MKLFSTNIQANQLRLKLLSKAIYQSKLINLSLGTSIINIRSFRNKTILENLLFLEFLSFLRGNIRAYKKSYQSPRVELLSIIKEKATSQFLTLLKIFYVPLLKRRNSKPYYATDASNNIFFELSFIKELPFIPEIYFRHKNPVIASFYLKKKIKKESILLLNYFTNLK